MIRRELGEGWTVMAGPQAHAVPDAVHGVALPATVPGDVHLDLMAAGLLEDPYHGRNEHHVQWVSQAEWAWTTSFELPEGAATRHALVFEGLDTVAVVEVDGVELLRTCNQHRTYRVDLPDAAPGPRTLRVRFGRVRDTALALRVGLGDRPHNYPEPYNFVRKSAASFGWDWGPDLAGVGIWKPVRLESWATARIASLRPHLTVTPEGTGVVDIDVDVDVDIDIDIDVEPGRGLDVGAEGGAATGAGPGVHAPPLALEVAVGGVRRSCPVTGGAPQRLRIEVPDVDLWWPRGLGAPTLYELQARLLDADGEELDTWTRRVGFRTVEHRTAPDADGREYTLAVNGVEVFVRGANWIPDDCFLGRVDRARYRERIMQAVGANMNLLRVWGGGVFEKDEFYDVCDEEGVLVSQDFLFACAAYPEEEPLRTEVELEARDNVARIMPHPSMVLWNGSNENIWGFVDWGWQETLAGRTWGLGYYLGLLPELVAELDPTTPYWASSPYSGTMDLHPNDPDHGNQHLWDVWNTVDYRHYADTRPRFVSEFGYQGPASWATIAATVDDDPLSADGVDLLHHQKASDGNGKLARGMAPHLPEPQDFDEWHYLTQLNQARAVAFGIEWFRSLRPRCTGAVVWQLNDCWPATSWAAVDGHGRRKPLWYELRRVFADRLLTVQEDGDGGLAVVAVNDGQEAWTDELVVSRLTVDGTEAAAHRAPLDVAPRSVQRLVLPPEVAVPEQPAREGVLAQAGGRRALRFFREDRDMDFGRARYDVRAAGVDGGVALTVSARSLVRDLVVGADRVDPGAVVDEQVVTLLPGESRTFTVTTGAAADDPRWAGPPVVRAVNDAAWFDR